MLLTILIEHTVATIEEGKEALAWLKSIIPPGVEVKITAECREVIEPIE